MQGIQVTFPVSRFNDFTSAISSFNKRTEAVNRSRKKKLFKRVNRYPVCVNGDRITCRIDIKSRREVLWQELTGILERYR